MIRQLFLPLVASLMMALPAEAQEDNMPKVVDRYGRVIDMPEYGSTEAEALLPRRCLTTERLAKEAEAESGMRRVIGHSRNYVPRTGTINIPVLLVQFKDVKFKVNNPKKAFEQFFNGTTQENLGNSNDFNIGSVKQYFHDMSSGTFTPQFTVYGPVEVPDSEKVYGGSSDEGGDESPRKLVLDAISALQKSNEAITDASPFSSDGSTIDCVYVIYAGLGQNNQGLPTAVWANTSLVGGSLAGKSLNWYSMAGELSPRKRNGNVMITGIGVTCHELSHALGLPDIYPTSSNASHLNNQAMEYWDLMDGGEYAGNGFAPTAYTAWEKSQMEWPVDIRTLSADEQVSSTTPTTDGGTAWKIDNPENAKEYFMLEHVEKRGWNSGAYGSGLMVYHVNQPSTEININTYLNNQPGYPGMAIVPADGVCTSVYQVKNGSDYFNSLRGDLFPGTGNSTTLTVSRLDDLNPKPNFYWYNRDFNWYSSSKNSKNKTNKALQNITYDPASHTLSFGYVHDVATGIKDIRSNRATAGGRIYTLSGQYVGTDMSRLPSGLYIVDGRKVMK